MLPQRLAGAPFRPLTSLTSSGGIVRWQGSNGQQALFATNPDSHSFRVNQTVFASTNNGKTFDRRLKIDTSGGYATINLNNANQLAVFYDYAPDGSGVPGRSSKTAHGGCSFNLAIVDPKLLLEQDP